MRSYRHKILDRHVSEIFLRKRKRERERVRECGRKVREYECREREMLELLKAHRTQVHSRNLPISGQGLSILM